MRSPGQARRRRRMRKPRLPRTLPSAPRNWSTRRWASNATHRRELRLRRADQSEPRRSAALEWQLDWVRLRESPSFSSRMLDSRVHCREGVQIRSDQRLVGGSWYVERLEVSVEAPFRTSVECSAETAAILTRCTAPISLRDLARDLVADGLIGSKGVEAAVVSLASFFVNAGCLDTELLPGPAADA